MPRSSRFKFTVPVIAALLGFVLTLIAPEEADIGRAPAQVLPRR
ncbi:MULTISPECIES: hypothetical protein [Roseateles]|nr:MULTISPECIES: hypothetical protein [unclassified Roseateles]HEV6967259.1 hypothetical protein [Roseateles sp.]